MGSKDRGDFPAHQGCLGQLASLSMGSRVPRAALACPGFGESLARKESQVPVENEG